MDNLEKVKRHLSKPIPIVLVNDGQEDTFMFKPLTVEQQAILMELSRGMKDRPKNIIDGVEVPEVTKEDLNEMFELLKEIVKHSLEGLDNKTIESFVNNNFEQLSEKISDLVPNNKNSKALEAIKRRVEENAKQ